MFSSLHMFSGFKSSVIFMQTELTRTTEKCKVHRLSPGDIYVVPHECHTSAPSVLAYARICHVLVTTLWAERLMPSRSPVSLAPWGRGL